MLLYNTTTTKRSYLIHIQGTDTKYLNISTLFIPGIFFSKLTLNMQQNSARNSLIS